MLIMCLACALVLPAALASGAEAVIHYQKESLPTYERQLSGGEIAAATFNKKIRSLHLTLKNGQHVLVVYPPHEQAKFAAALEAKGIPVAVLEPAAANAEIAKKPVHHKLRYIAGGILVLVIIVVGAVLLLDRRRKLAAE
jgi:hypothetical protein